MKRPTRTKLLLALSATMLALTTGCTSDKKLVEEGVSSPTILPIKIEGFKLDFDLIQSDELREAMIQEISTAVMGSVKRMEFDHVEILSVDLTDTEDKGKFSGELKGFAYEKDNETPYQLYVTIKDNEVTMFNTFRTNVDFNMEDNPNNTPDIFNTYEATSGHKIVIFNDAFNDDDIYWKFADELFDEIIDLIKEYHEAELEIYNTELTINSNDKLDGEVFADLVYGDLLETFNLTIKNSQITDVERFEE